MEKKITVIPGDGIGPEVTWEAVRILKAVASKFDHRFYFDTQLLGAVAIEETGEPLPQKTIKSAFESDAIFLGAIGHPKYDNDPGAPVRPEQGLLQLRKELNLFANIRPVKAYPSLQHLSPLKPGKSKNTDLVIYRELTGGIYFGEKYLNDEKTEASDVCNYSRAEIERIAFPAFEAAMKRRKKLTLVDKANVLETSRLWRRTVKDVALKFPEVAVDFLYIDNAAMQLILNPDQFDVILTENMFGDILSDEASVIGGSLGLLPSASIGSKAMFEPVHGSYPQAAGKDIANPLGAILSVALMMDYFEAPEEALAIRNAVEWSLTNGYVTKDIDPVNSYYTSTIGELIADYISNEMPQNINARNVKLGQATII